MSVITALNAQKDKINEMGCRNFAEETKQELVDFYSEGILVDNVGSEARQIMMRPNCASTKGQEAIVIGRQEAVGSHGQRILDTLFSELMKPPRTVSIPGLPPNVCSLPDDMTVLILPNFATTNYSSQGKSRDFNVVDLHNCKNHYLYYTALSRSSTSAGTIILQGLSPAKITKGISGHPRQEFREL
ncbi:hypothetical protein B0H19DRAFT_1209204 [Mycena capillaripes]|nr:hypothetical protein B0H19DRAFT_1209204 [Mycena capillaripes]